MPAKSFFIVSTFLAFSYFTSNDLQAQVNETDSLSLVEFYHATNGDNWTNNENWLIGRVITWHGITLNETLDSVKVINLYSNNLTGMLPDLELPALEELILTSNHFSSLPDFSYLINLKHLNVVANELITVPNFSNLPKLEDLGLMNNNLSVIPDFINLPKLTSLNLMTNELINLPDFSNLSTLKNLMVSCNYELSGLPDFSNLPNLELLRVECCTLDSLPNFSNLPKLEWLRVANNKIRFLHDFNLPSLVYLDLLNNDLTSVPNFSNLPSLGIIDLSYNHLTKVPNFSNISPGGINLNHNQLRTVPYFTPIPVILSLEENKLAFREIEYYAQQDDIINFSYTPQDTINTYQLNDSILYISAGGTVDNNTYRWYKDNIFLIEVIGDSTLQITEEGQYHCEVTNSIAPDLTLHSHPMMTGTISDVWPGDATNDGIVNMGDFLALGLAYGFTGIERPNASINWEGQYCEEWEGNFSNSTNFKYADANGDGIINNLDNDILLQHYQKTHPVSNNQNLEIDTTFSPTIPFDIVVSDTIQVTEQDTFEYAFDILINNNNTLVSSIYGLAFTVKVAIEDSWQLERYNTDFSNSWIGNIGDNMMAMDTLIRIEEVTDEAFNYYYDIAITKIDHQESLGTGQVCKIECVMSVGNVKTAMVEPSFLNYEITLENVQLLTNNGAVNLATITEEGEITVLPSTSVAIEKPLENASLTVYPNPASHYITFENDCQTNDCQYIRIFNIQGHQVLQTLLKTNFNKIDIQQLTNGIYTVQIGKGKSKTTQKFMVQK